MTLLEVTVVIFVLLSLMAILFFGARAWKRGSDRALCIMHIQTVQKGIRSYSNLYDYKPGDIVPDLKSQLIGPGKFMETEPNCPANGLYGYGTTAGSNTIPAIGLLYLDCSLGRSADHVPTSYEDW